MNIRDLETTGFVRVAYPPLLRLRVREAMASWKAFCQLPADVKGMLQIGTRLKDIGYVLRVSEGRANHDDKEFFHAARNLPQEVREKAKNISDPRALAFIDATDSLLKEVTPLVREFVREVESGFGLNGFEEEVMDNRDNWKFRYLHYFPSDAGREIASAHADRGGFTLHMFETHEGADYLGFDKAWRPLPVSEGETVIFPSLHLQHRAESRMNALCHRVRATSEAAREGRYSMVAFIDFIMDKKFNDAGYRLQDLEPGFNYFLSKEDLEKYFVPR